MKKVWLYLLILVILLVPTFARMLRPGIFSTQDFHYFRLYEFDQCVNRLELPCRWAADAGLRYGEPLFNFYAQLPYAAGELFHIIGFELVDSLKILFILSLVLSGISMYFLSRKIWKSDISGIISAVFYVYAPYRAVDVWVRGILPEALAFIFFPLIILFFEKIIEDDKKKDYLIFGILLAATILTHNLSAVLFIPFFTVWGGYRIVTLRKYRVLGGLALSTLGALVLSGFYILPVVFESKYINLEAATTMGYFDFRAHFTTIYQTLISRYWGYGGSTWGDGDGLNLSVGIFQWLVPILALVSAFVAKKRKIFMSILMLVAIGWLTLFLTHNKSTFIWEAVSPLKYIQFPWRFLGQAVFSFSLVSGAVAVIFEKKLVVIISTILIAGVIASNFSFFREDIWFSYNDSDLTSGKIFEEQTRASIADYWPMFGHEIPTDPASGEFINYFPGWKIKQDGKLVDAKADRNGLIPSKDAVFANTTVRTIGNIVSLVGVVSFATLWFARMKKL